jgi:hypothetical protein
MLVHFEEKLARYGAVRMVEMVETCSSGIYSLVNRATPCGHKPFGE